MKKTPNAVDFENYNINASWFIDKFNDKPLQYLIKNNSSKLLYILNNNSRDLHKLENKMQSTLPPGKVTFDKAIQVPSSIEFRHPLVRKSKKFTDICKAQDLFKKSETFKKPSNHKFLHSDLTDTDAKEELQSITTTKYEDKTTLSVSDQKKRDKEPLEKFQQKQENTTQKLPRFILHSKLRPNNSASSILEITPGALTRKSKIIKYSPEDPFPIFREINLTDVPTAKEIQNHETPAENETKKFVNGKSIKESHHSPIKDVSSLEDKLSSLKEKEDIKYELFMYLRQQQSQEPNCKSDKLLKKSSSVIQLVEKGSEEQQHLQNIKKGFRSPGEGSRSKIVKGKLPDSCRCKKGCMCQELHHDRNDDKYHTNKMSDHKINSYVLRNIAKILKCRKSRSKIYEDISDKLEVTLNTKINSRTSDVSLEIILPYDTNNTKLSEYPNESNKPQKRDEFLIDQEGRLDKSLSLPRDLPYNRKSQIYQLNTDKSVRADRFSHFVNETDLPFRITFKSKSNVTLLNSNSKNLSEDHTTTFEPMSQSSFSIGKCNFDKDFKTKEYCLYSLSVTDKEKELIKSNKEIENKFSDINTAQKNIYDRLLYQKTFLERNTFKTSAMSLEFGGKINKISQLSPINCPSTDSTVNPFDMKNENKIATTNYSNESLNNLSTIFEHDSYSENSIFLEHSDWKDYRVNHISLSSSNVSGSSIPESSNKPDKSEKVSGKSTNDLTTKIEMQKNSEWFKDNPHIVEISQSKPFNIVYPKSIISRSRKRDRKIKSGQKANFEGACKNGKQTYPLSSKWKRKSSKGPKVKLIRVLCFEEGNTKYNNITNLHTPNKCFSEKMYKQVASEQNQFQTIMKAAQTEATSASDESSKNTLLKDQQHIWPIKGMLDEEGLQKELFVSLKDLIKSRIKEYGRNTAVSENIRVSLSSSSHNSKISDVESKSEISVSKTKENKNIIRKDKRIICNYLRKCLRQTRSLTNIKSATPLQNTSGSSKYNLLQRGTTRRLEKSYSNSFQTEATISSEIEVSENLQRDTSFSEISKIPFNSNQMYLKLVSDNMASSIDFEKLNTEKEAFFENASQEHENLYKNNSFKSVCSDVLNNSEIFFSKAFSTTKGCIGNIISSTNITFRCPIKTKSIQNINFREEEQWKPYQTNIFAQTLLTRNELDNNLDPYKSKCSKTHSHPLINSVKQTAGVHQCIPDKNSKVEDNNTTSTETLKLDCSILISSEDLTESTRCVPEKLCSILSAKIEKDARSSRSIQEYDLVFDENSVEGQACLIKDKKDKLPVCSSSKYANKQCPTDLTLLTNFNNRSKAPQKFGFAQNKKQCTNEACKRKQYLPPANSYGSKGCPCKKVSSLLQNLSKESETPELPVIDKPNQTLNPDMLNGKQDYTINYPSSTEYLETEGSNSFSNSQLFDEEHTNGINYKKLTKRENESEKKKKNWQKHSSVVKPPSSKHLTKLSAKKEKLIKKDLIKVIKTSSLSASVIDLLFKIIHEAEAANRSPSYSFNKLPNKMKQITLSDNSDNISLDSKIISYTNKKSTKTERKQSAKPEFITQQQLENEDMRIKPVRHFNKLKGSPNRLNFMKADSKKNVLPVARRFVEVKEDGGEEKVYVDKQTSFDKSSDRPLKIRPKRRRTSGSAISEVSGAHEKVIFNKTNNNKLSKLNRSQKTDLKSKNKILLKPLPIKEEKKYGCRQREIIPHCFLCGVSLTDLETNAENRLTTDLQSIENKSNSNNPLLEFIKRDLRIFPEKYNVKEIPTRILPSIKDFPTNLLTQSSNDDIPANKSKSTQLSSFNSSEVVQLNSEITSSSSKATFIVTKEVPQISKGLNLDFDLKDLNCSSEEISSIPLDSKMNVQRFFVKSNVQHSSSEESNNDKQLQTYKINQEKKFDKTYSKSGNRFLGLKIKQDDCRAYLKTNIKKNNNVKDLQTLPRNSKKQKGKLGLTKHCNSSGRMLFVHQFTKKRSKKSIERINNTNSIKTFANGMPNSRIPRLKKKNQFRFRKFSNKHFKFPTKMLSELKPAYNDAENNLLVSKSISTRNQTYNFRKQANTKNKNQYPTEWKNLTVFRNEENNLSIQHPFENNLISRCSDISRNQTKPGIQSTSSDEATLILKSSFPRSASNLSSFASSNSKSIPDNNSFDVFPALKLTIESKEQSRSSKAGKENFNDPNVNSKHISSFSFYEVEIEGKNRKVLLLPEDVPQMKFTANNISYCYRDEEIAKLKHKKQNDFANAAPAVPQLDCNNKTKSQKASSRISLHNNDVETYFYGNRIQQLILKHNKQCFNKKHKKSFINKYESCKKPNLQMDSGAELHLINSETSNPNKPNLLKKSKDCAGKIQHQRTSECKILNQDISEIKISTNMNEGTTTNKSQFDFDIESNLKQWEDGKQKHDPFNTEKSKNVLFNWDELNVNAQVLPMFVLENRKSKLNFIVKNKKSKEYSADPRSLIPNPSAAENIRRVTECFQPKDRKFQDTIKGNTKMSCLSSDELSNSELKKEKVNKSVTWTIPRKLFGRRPRKNKIKMKRIKAKEDHLKIDILALTSNSFNNLSKKSQPEIKYFKEAKLDKECEDVQQHNRKYETKSKLRQERLSEGVNNLKMHSETSRSINTLKDNLNRISCSLLIEIINKSNEIFQNIRETKSVLRNSKALLKYAASSMPSILKSSRDLKFAELEKQNKNDFSDSYFENLEKDSFSVKVTTIPHVRIGLQSIRSKPKILIKRPVLHNSDFVTLLDLAFIHKETQTDFLKDAETQTFHLKRAICRETALIDKSINTILTDFIDSSTPMFKRSQKPANPAFCSIQSNSSEMLLLFEAPVQSSKKTSFKIIYENSLCKRSEDVLAYNLLNITQNIHRKNNNKTVDAGLQTDVSTNYSSQFCLSPHKPFDSDNCNSMPFKIANVNNQETVFKNIKNSNWNVSNGSNASGDISNAMNIESDFLKPEIAFQGNPSEKQEFWQIFCKKRCGNLTTGNITKGNTPRISTEYSCEHWIPGKQISSTIYSSQNKDLKTLLRPKSRNLYQESYSRYITSLVSGYSSENRNIQNIRRT